MQRLRERGNEEMTVGLMPADSRVFTFPFWKWSLNEASMISDRKVQKGGHRLDWIAWRRGS